MAKTAEKTDKKEKALKAIRDLSSTERIEVAAKVFGGLTDKEREDLLDHLAIEEAMKSPGIPFEEYLEECEEKRKKKAGK